MDTIRMVLSTAARLCLVLAGLLSAGAAAAIESVAPDRNCPEYRAIAATFDLLQPDKEGYFAAIQLKAVTRPAHIDASGSWASVSVHGPGANPWNTQGEFASNVTYTSADTAPWGGPLWRWFIAYAPKLDKVTNPYRDPEGNPANLCWRWSYPAHRVQACAWWDGEVDETMAIARLRPLAETLHGGMIRAGLADGASQGPAAARAASRIPRCCDDRCRMGSMSPR